MSKKKIEPIQSVSKKYTNMFQAYVAFWRRGFTEWRGTSSRSEYWWSWLINFVILMFWAAIFALVMAKLYSDSPLIGICAVALGGLFLIYTAALIVPSISLTVRRFHDAGFSSWWMLLFVLAAVPVPGFDIAGCLIIFILTLLPTKSGCNPYHQFNK